MKPKNVGWVEERNPTQPNVNKPLILLILLFISGCNAPSSSFNVNSETTEACASQPPTELVLREVEDITLTSSLEKIGEGRIKSTETVGYKFQGKSGQQLQLELEPEDTCIWVIDPNSEVFEKTTLTEDGIYLVQLAAPKGKQVNYIISMGLGMKSPSPVASKTPTPRPSPSPSPSPSPTSSPRNQLSQQEARKIVQAWYDAKPDIFGPNYQTSAVKRYTTGKLYYETVEKCNDGICGGSVGWLKQYGCYYTYNYSNIQRVVRFSSSDSNATLVVNVKEQLQLHGPRSAGCGKAANTYQKDVTYQLEKEGTTWKINSYKVGS